MTATDVILAVGVILGAGLLSYPIGALLRLPYMLVLVGVGALLGPSVLDLIDVPLTSTGAQVLLALGVSSSPTTVSAPARWSTSRRSSGSRPGLGLSSETWTGSAANVAQLRGMGTSRPHVFAWSFDHFVSGGRAGIVTLSDASSRRRQSRPRTVTVTLGPPSSAT